MEYWNDKFPIVKDMINVLYKYCSVGGCCHIVTDDDNIYDRDLDFVIEYAQHRGDRIDSELSIAICKILKTMTFLQRAVLLDSLNYNIDFHDKESFDAFYDSSEEHLTCMLKEYDYDDLLKECDADIEHDGCVGCAYRFVSQNEEPCKNCKGNHITPNDYPDLWKADEKCRSIYN